MQATGIVAYFDILGYKSFLRNSPCNEATTLVVSTIANAEQALQSYYQETSRGEPEGSELMGHVRTITWVVFSDTLLLLCPIDSSMTGVDAVRRWHLLILSAQIISKHMFEVGLPLRGAITYGDYVHEKNCFAGRSILDAHDLSNSLQAAVSVIDTEAYNQMKRVIEPFALQQDLTAKLLLLGSLLEYDVPMASSLQRNYVLNYLSVLGLGTVPSAWAGTPNDIVMRSFTQHNKTLGPREKEKAENTARFFAFVESHFPGSLGEGQE